jgi:hypothetical protein
MSGTELLCQAKLATAASSDVERSTSQSQQRLFRFCTGGEQAATVPARDGVIVGCYKAQVDDCRPNIMSFEGFLVPLSVSVLIGFPWHGQRSIFILDDACAWDTRGQCLIFVLQ